MASKKKTYGTTRSGRTIDDDVVDEFVEKAERGYARFAAPGGPPGARRTGRRAPARSRYSRSSSRTMTAMMSATIAMVRVFMRTSPLILWALLSVSTFAKYRDDVGRTR